MTALASALRRGLGGIRRSPLLQLTAVCTIALSLVLVGTVALIAANVARLGESWGRGTQLTVYLEDGVSASRVRQIATALGKLPGVETVRTVEPRQAWERLRRGLGERAELLDGVEESFLPTTIEAALKPGVAAVIRAHPAFERLEQAAGVEEVELMGDWAERLLSLERMIDAAGWAVGLLVLCACLYIVGSTIRLGVFARREEIAIQKLVGATDGFVKAPFLVEGALQGALGAAAAAALLYALYRLAAPHVDAVLGSVLAAAPLAFFPASIVALAVTSGALVGLCGSALALGRYVKV